MAKSLLSSGSSSPDPTSPLLLQLGASGLGREPREASRAEGQRPALPASVARQGCARPFTTWSRNTKMKFASSRIRESRFQTLSEKEGSLQAAM